MNKSMTLAEMANNANYAAMDYAQLVEINLAFLLALGKIKPLISSRRQEEMEMITCDYVKKMKGYCATREEILNNLFKEAEVIKDTPVYTSEDEDVQLTTPSTSEKRDDRNEAPLSLPKASSSVTEGLEADISQGDNISRNGSVSGCVLKPIDSGEKEMSIYDNAIADALTRPVNDSIDTTKPYFIDYSYDIDENEHIHYHSSFGHNLAPDKIQEFKAVGPKYVKNFMKCELIESTDDRLVARTNSNCIVRLYHTPTNNGEEFPVETTATPCLSAEEKKKKARRRATMKEAIEKVRRDVLEDAETKAPFLYKCALQHGRGFLMINRRLPKEYMDEEALVKMKNELDIYTQCYYEYAEVMLTKEAVAVMRDDNIEVVFFNMPVENNEEGRVETRVKKTKKDSIKTPRVDPRSKSITLFSEVTKELKTWPSFRACEKELYGEKGGRGMVSQLFDPKKGLKRLKGGWVLPKEEEKTPVNEKAHKRAVIQMKKDKEGNLWTVNTFNSITEASQVTGISHSGISKVCSGTYQSTGGFVWKYAEGAA